MEFPTGTPTRIGRFEIEAPPGPPGREGTFLARDPRDGRRVTLRVVPTRSRPLPETRAEFLERARAHAALGHPSLHRVLAAGEAGGYRYVVEEPVVGTSLADVLAVGRLESERAIAIAAAIAGAVATIEGRGLVAGALGPERVRLEPGGRPTIPSLDVAPGPRRPGDAVRGLGTIARALSDAALGPDAAIRALERVAADCSGEAIPTVAEVAERLSALERNWRTTLSVGCACGRVHRAGADAGGTEVRCGCGAALHYPDPIEPVRRPPPSGASRGFRRGLPAALALALAGAAALVLLRWLPDEDLSVAIDDPLEGLETREAVLLVAGRAGSGDAEVRVAGGDWLPTSPDGSFRTSASLAAGENRIVVEARRPDGATARRTVVVTRVEGPPELVWLFPPDDAEATESPIVVAGRVDGAGVRVRIRWNDGPWREAILVGPGGRFAVPVDLASGLNEIEIEVAGRGHESVTSHLRVRRVDAHENRLAIESIFPPDGATVSTPAVRITGRVDPRARVRAKIVGEAWGLPASPRADGEFALDLALAEGENRVEIEASRDGELAAATIRISRRPPGTAEVLELAVSSGPPPRDGWCAVTGVARPPGTRIRVARSPGSWIEWTAAGEEGRFEVAIPLLEGALNRIEARTGEDTEARTIEVAGPTATRVEAWLELPDDDRGRRRVRRLRDGATMVWVPPGEFPIGAPGPDALPERRVSVEGFFLDEFEVTRERYLGFCRATGRWVPPERERPIGDRDPVVYVSLFDARAYAQWTGADLPTEIEWERAARGAGDPPPPPGRHNGPDGGARDGSVDGFGSLAPVGSFPEASDPSGCLDLIGNALEWCELERVDPARPIGVLRGGSFSAPGSATRRWEFEAEHVSESVGFRCVATGSPVVRAPLLAELSPVDRSTTDRGRVVVEGRSGDLSATVRVRTDGADWTAWRHVSPGGLFWFPLAIEPGERRIEVELRGWHGAVERATRLVVRPPPAEPPPAVDLPAGWVDLGRNEPGFREVRRPADGATMIEIPAGSFLMGSDVEEWRLPVRPVEIETYFIDRNEVTWRSWLAFCNDTRRTPPIVPTGETLEHPARSIAWAEAREFARWAGCDLPTEARWEKAGRGTDGRPYPWGTHRVEWRGRDHANSDAWDTMSRDGFHGSAPVGSFPHGASPYGCLDLSGNVWEWCLDLVDGAPGDATRVARGGSYEISDPNLYRREFHPAGDPRAAVGFRCARDAGSRRK